MGLPGGSAWFTYTYICFVFHLVGLYANMAEMSGVRQIDGSCPFFGRNLKSILNYKMCFNKQNRKRIIFYNYFIFENRFSIFVEKRT